jgi:hypothetical protein
MVTGLAATSSTSTGIAEQYATTTASDRAIFEAIIIKLREIMIEIDATLIQSELTKKK